MRCVTHFQRLSRDRSGVAAVEFAFVAPIMLALLAGAVDIGRAVDQSIRLENAARAGATHATLYPTDTAGIATSATTALGSLTGANITISPVLCGCPDAAGVVPEPTAAACGGACATMMARYVRVTVTVAQFQPVFPPSALIPFTDIGATSANVLARLI